MTSSIYKIKDNLHNDGVVNTITVDTSGSNYTTAPVSFSGGTPTKVATAESVISGAIQNVIVTDAGSANHSIGLTTVSANRGGGPSGTDATLHPRIFGLLVTGDTNINLVNGGTGFSFNTVVNIPPPDLGGRQAKAKILRFEGSTIESIEITVAGTGYSFLPPITLSNTGGGTGAIITIRRVEGDIKQIDVANNTVPAVTIDNGGTTYFNGELAVLEGATSGNRSAMGRVTASSGIVTSVAVQEAGDGYTDGEALKILGVDSGGDDATTNVITTVTNNGGTNYEDDKTTIDISSDGSGTSAQVGNILGDISDITITDGGQGYDSAPTVIIGGDGSGATATATIDEISGGEDILQEDIAITSDMVSPGGGGILRVYFSFDFLTTPSTISVSNNNVLKGNLNADNLSQVVDDGYYRFDLDVESGDSLNFQSSIDIDIVHFFRSHLVQFGA